MIRTTSRVWALLVLSISCIDLCAAECSLPTRPMQGELIYESRNPPDLVSNGYTIRVICNARFRRSPEGDGFMTCSNSAWSPTFDCVAGCEPLPPIHYGEITYRLNGEVARYTCTAPGYRIHGENKRRCGDDLVWTGEAPMCRALPRCPAIELTPHIQNTRVFGRFRDNLWTIGSKHNFTCQGSNYHMDVPSGTYPAIECQRTGWNATVPTCIEVTCPSIHDEIENGRSTAENRTYNLKESIEFICDSGYRTTSPSWRVCILKKDGINGVEGVWEGVTPRCEVTTCPRLAQIENGMAISDSQNVDSNGTFRCNSGYDLIGDARLACLSTGQWNGSVPVCDNDESHCPVLGAPLNGRKEGDRYGRFDRVRFSCNSDYALIGSQERECRSDGQWTGELTRCMGSQDFDDVNQIAAVLGEQIDGMKEKALVDNVIPEVSGGNNRSRFIPLNHEYGVDLYFMFDASASVGEENFEKAKKFAKDLVKEIGVDDSPNSLRVGAMSFNSQADIAFHTVQFQTTEDVVNAINEISYIGGGTNIAQAFERVRTVMIPQSGNRDKSFRTTFLITDGKATEGGTPGPSAWKLEADKGVKIHCLGVSENADKVQLSQVASYPKREYLFFLKDYASLGPLIKAVTNQTDDYSECGSSKLTVPPGAEKDETPAVEGAWPWQVYLEIYKDGASSYSVCGGTLLRNDTILTAAHCFENVRTVEAFVGVTDRPNKNKGQLRTIRPADITQHENFNPNTHSHDIALIHVDPPYTLKPNVRPACLPNPEKEDRLLHRGSAIMTGWGHSGTVAANALNPEHVPEDDLQQLTLPLHTRPECIESLETDPEADWFDESMTCAGFLNKELGACRGDSGGPLMKYASNGNRRQWTVIGITSWGRGCALRNELDFFTNVPHFVEWIERKMNPPQNDEA